MISKAQISFVNSLKLKKHRVAEKFFVAEGDKIVREILNSELGLKWIIATSEWLDINKKLLRPFAEYIIETDCAAMKKISSLTTPSAVLAVVATPEAEQPIYNSQDLYMALDEIQDPGNLGTIIRICDWFGIRNLICSVGCADIYLQKTIQASMGAFLRVKIFYGSLEKEISTYKNNTANPIYGTFLEGKNIYETNLSQGAFIVMGNEGKGINKSLEELVTEKLYIPSFSELPIHAESLNVSMATAITCSEFKRREL